MMMMIIGENWPFFILDKIKNVKIKMYTFIDYAFIMY